MTFRDSVMKQTLFLHLLVIVLNLDQSGYIQIHVNYQLGLTKTHVNRLEGRAFKCYKFNEITRNLLLSYNESI